MSNDTHVAYVYEHQHYERVTGSPAFLKGRSEPILGAGGLSNYLVGDPRVPVEGRIVDGNLVLSVSEQPAENSSDTVLYETTVLGRVSMAEAERRAVFARHAVTATQRRPGQPPANGVHGWWLGWRRVDVTGRGPDPVRVARALRPTG
jgi:hypothetical protein